MSASTKTTSPDVRQLMRNRMLLPIVRAHFEADRRSFEHSGRYAWRSSYAAVAARAIRRIDADVAKVSDALRRAGCRLGEERRDREHITQTVEYRGEKQTYTLLWGTFEGELELLIDYYLGNTEAALKCGERR